nr:hypothetical protein [Corynebacterium faecium]
MSKNQPRCYCGGEMKRNGTTSKGTTRWRCKQCGASKTDHEIGRPALYDNAIDTEYTHSIGIQKGHI